MGYGGYPHAGPGGVVGYNPAAHLGRPRSGSNLAVQGTGQGLQGQGGQGVTTGMFRFSGTQGVKSEEPRG